MRVCCRKLLALGFLSIATAAASPHLDGPEAESLVTGVVDSPDTPSTAVSEDGDKPVPSSGDSIFESDKDAEFDNTPPVVLTPIETQEADGFPVADSVDSEAFQSFSAESGDEISGDENGLDSFGIENVSYAGQASTGNSNEPAELRNRSSSVVSPPKENETSPDVEVATKMLKDLKLEQVHSTCATPRRRPLGATREYVIIGVSSCVVGPLMVMLIIAYLNRILEEA